MHCVFLGVVKQLVVLWFNSKHSGQRWYCGSNVEKVDKRLLEIKPPSVISRVPRSIEHHLKFWKGTVYETLYQQFWVRVLLRLIVTRNLIFKCLWSQGYTCIGHNSLYNSSTNMPMKAGTNAILKVIFCWLQLRSAKLNYLKWVSQIRHIHYVLLFSPGFSLYVFIVRLALTYFLPAYIYFDSSILSFTWRWPKHGWNIVFYHWFLMLLF